MFFFYFKPLLPPKTEVHNIAFPSEKVILSESGVKSCSVYKWKQFQTNIFVDFDVRGQQEMYFFTGGNVIMNYELVVYPKAT